MIEMNEEQMRSQSDPIKILQQEMNDVMARITALKTEMTETTTQPNLIEQLNQLEQTILTNTLTDYEFQYTKSKILKLLNDLEHRRWMDFK